MPMFVCDRKGIFYANRSLNYGEHVIAESNPNPSYFHELPEIVVKHNKKKKKVK